MLCNSSKMLNVKTASKFLQLFKMVGILLICGGDGPLKVQIFCNAQLNVASDSRFVFFVFFK